MEYTIKMITIACSVYWDIESEEVKLNHVGPKHVCGTSQVLEEQENGVQRALEHTHQCRYCGARKLD